MLRKSLIFAIKIAVVGLIAIVFFILQHNGLVWFNMPSKARYPLQGVDVSSYQGKINWQILKNQGISFAFIKATEGSSWVDKNFASNFANAYNNDLFIGAYHFFSFESSGTNQAKNIIENVPNATNLSSFLQQHNINLDSNKKRLLPPVVDIEFYANFVSNPPSKESVYKELDSLLFELERHFKQKPIIYTTASFYKEYLRGKYAEYPLWIRSIFFPPDSIFARIFKVYFSKEQWKFWQYNPHGVLDGYSGTQKYIDLNVFNGTFKELEALAK